MNNSISGNSIERRILTELLTSKATRMSVKLCCSRLKKMMEISQDLGVLAAEARPQATVYFLKRQARYGRRLLRYCANTSARGNN